MIKVVILMCLMCMIAACSDDKTDKVEQHVWQEQTDMIGKAQDVRGVVIEQATEQRKLIEKNTQ